LVRVSKRFGPVQALEDVSIEFAPGRVHALVGENGAGKSTLTKILAGAYSPDAGEVWLHGQPAELKAPREALASGISVIYQDLNLLPHLSVGANIFLGREPRTRLGFIDQAAIRSGTRALLDSLDAHIDPSAAVNDLSIADRQLVEIARALTVKSELLIMDEPTASLSQKEADKLFQIIGRLKLGGVAIVYISHDLNHVFGVADQITVLKDGRVMMTKAAGTTTPAEVITLMVGRPIGDLFPERPATPHVASGVAALELRDCSRPGQFHNISFVVHPGEIVGFSGLVGAGRTELAHAIFGVRSVDVAARTEGEILIQGKAVAIDSPQDAIANGIGYVPEDRKIEALLANMPVKANITLPQVAAIAQLGVIQQRLEDAIARQEVERLKVRTSSIENPVENLSGGNQQKVVVGRWLAMDCRILILDEPTAGVDIGTKVEIYHLIRELANAGAAILLISSSLPEILGLSDRIMVMSKGRITAALNPGEATEEELVRAALGVAALAPA
jgi:ABC-type sugar transport system ATPase subunit